MLVRMTVPCCDFTDKQYPTGAQGGGYVARGATGRWCVVMYAGPEYCASRQSEMISVEEAYAKIASLGSNDYADF